MCTPRSGHFVVVFFFDNASVALLSVPPTQTFRQSTAPGTCDSKKQETKSLQRGHGRKQLCACRGLGGLPALVKQKRHVTGQDFWENQGLATLNLSRERCSHKLVRSKRHPKHQDLSWPSRMIRKLSTTQPGDSTSPKHAGPKNKRARPLLWQ